MQTESDLNMQQVGPEDTERLLGLYKNVARRVLEETGIEQWSPAVLDRIIPEYIEGGMMYVAYEKDNVEPVGSVVLQNELPSSWDGQDIEGKITYLCKLARSEKHKGVGASILHWAESLARENGADAMLIDVVTKKESLQEFYKDRGYVAIGQTGESADGRLPITFFRKDLTEQA